MKNKTHKLPIIAGVFFLLFACSHATEQTEICQEKMISADENAATTCPFLTKDDQGNVALSWVKEINNGTVIMCYAISTDSGYSFGKPIEISPSIGVYPHGENLPKIIFKPSGEIIAVWGASNPNAMNKYSGLIYYAQSFNKGKSWSKAIPLVTDTTSYDQRYFDFAVLKNGEVGITWLDNRTKTDKEGMTLYYASTKGKNGFQNEKVIAETCCQCCRTDLFVDSKNNIHIAYRSIINDSIRDMVHTVSTDEGKTFSEPKRISADNWVIDGCPHTGPTMTGNKSGLHFTWYSAGGIAAVYYCESKDNGKTFSSRQLVRKEARHPQMATFTDETIGTVWEEKIQNDSTFFSKIVLQLKKPSGLLTRQIVTSDNVNADFPVLISNADKTVVVAWVQHTDDNATATQHGQSNHSKGEHVFYKMIHLE